MADGKEIEKTNSASVDGGQQVIPLDEEDKTAQEDQFVGATLELNDNNKNPADQPKVAFAGPGGDQSNTRTSTTSNDSQHDDAGPGLSRNRPGSVIGSRSTSSTSSRTSMRPNFIKSDVVAKTFFSYKGQNFETALQECRNQVKPDLDGKILGEWLLAEIDHWNMEKEKVVLLTENSVLVFKYNFITQTLYEFRRVMLHGIDTIAIGDFKYPDYSIMPDRQHGGVQLRWNKGSEPTFGQRWNPWCTDIPWLTFAHHPVLYNPKENETTTYNVDEFYESLLQAISKAYEEKRPGEKITVVEGPILINSYANIATIVHNDSGMGFFRDRNGISF
ncbi:hypothetical protein SNE40_014417 [Patella caerulea]|uniref:HSac2 domain-containing protein n=1 Tax=Patella caerulea TaxID=87958 RepID=A0AAN8JI61_PATCE